jgi:hypothetical protein
MSEFDLMRLAFLLDLGLYYLGIASQPFKRGAIALQEPAFSTPPSIPFFYFMRGYNRRFAQIARARRLRNKQGRLNHRRRFLFQGYTFAPTSAWPLAKAIAGWAGLEFREGWRSWLAQNRKSKSEVRKETEIPNPNSQTVIGPAAR